MHVRLTSPANTELAAALEWYANIERSLSVRFLDEYEVVIEKLRDNPWQFPVVHNGVRRAGLWRFPYGLLYRIHPAEVEIIACFHARASRRKVATGFRQKAMLNQTCRAIHAAGRIGTENAPLPRQPHHRS